MKNSCRTSRGFSLIELLIVIAVVGILGSIAYPSYTEYVMRTHRATAKTDLLQMAQWMERVATATGLYPTRKDQKDALTAQETQLSTERYTMSVDSTDGSTFTASAIPKGAQSGDRCGTLTLTNTGVRGISNAPANSNMTAEECWRR